ncbi:hypothetical protein RJ640_012504 [Escallonia rubra]|uniref:Uncharacterized protein n=1 Tax=Escallonia rubra TaxID=112253 RepID=A0AA88QQ08_9ASTE|nr:hypothetical protein RJ640_012504 [Escallonia rubra]
MISEYLREILSLADEIASACSPMSNVELIVKILSGLGPEFHEISATIRARDTPISYEELFDKLLDHEVFLKHEELKKHQTPIMVQVAQQTGSNNSNNRSNQRWHPQQSQRQNSNMPSQFFIGNSQPTWRPHLSNNQQPRFQCQLCEKYGHVACVCRSRSDNHANNSTYG